MADEQETMLSGTDEPLLPIADRRAPLLERVRRRRAIRRNPTRAVVTEIADAVVEDDPEEKEQLAQEAMQDFREQLSKSLGVGDDEIEDDIVDAFGSMFLLTEEDILTDETLEDRVEDDLDDDDEEEEGTDDETGFGS